MQQNDTESLPSSSSESENKEDENLKSESQKEENLDDGEPFYLVTILFMSTRIKAKVFKNDSLDQILARLRIILSGLNETN